MGGLGDAGLDGGAAASMTSTSPTGDSLSSLSLQHPYEDEDYSDDEEDEEMDVDPEMKEQRQQQRQPLPSTGGKEAEHPTTQGASLQAQIRDETKQKDQRHHQPQATEVEPPQPKTMEGEQQ